MKKIIFILLILMIGTLAFAEGQREESTASAEAQQTEANHSNLVKVQPPPTLEWSLERENLINQLNLWNDPNKLGYLYLLTDYGQLVAFHVIKGKVSSVNSLLTNPEQFVHPYYGVANGSGSGNSSYYQPMPSPDFDGSYGTNGDGIFFFLTDGTYGRWNGTYLLYDQPMSLNIEPLMTYEVKE